MKLSDIQPHYFPRQHYFARMLSSDVFVIRDDVQFVKNHKFPDGKRGISHQADSPIKTANGEKLLTINIKKRPASPISETLVSYDQGWARKHLNIIRQSYAKAPFFKDVFPGIEALLASQPATVAGLNVATTCLALGYLLDGEILGPEDCQLAEIRQRLQQQPSVPLKKLLAGSDVASPLFEGSVSASERIVKLCLLAEADEYITGDTAKNAYLETALFEDNGIKVVVQDWACREYPQLYQKNTGFIANLSILDLLMNVDRETALDSLLGGSRAPLRQHSTAA